MQLLQAGNNGTWKKSTDCRIITGPKYMGYSNSKVVKALGFSQPKVAS